MTLTQTPTTSLILLDPTGEVETREGTGAARAADLAGGTLGLLDNSMGWSHVVLDEVGAILRERYRVAEIVKARRPTGARRRCWAGRCERGSRQGAERAK